MRLPTHAVIPAPSVSPNKVCCGFHGVEKQAKPLPPPPLENTTEEFEHFRQMCEQKYSKQFKQEKMLLQNQF